jgi:hypothetical protein
LGFGFYKDFAPTALANFRLSLRDEIIQKIEGCGKRLLPARSASRIVPAILIRPAGLSWLGCLNYEA